jgi:O-acetylhomoserine/O-acetylserine sulfhydrylase-like pyridoxal-dependent enzyme
MPMHLLAVEKVLYPGLTSHPQHDIAKKQQHGFGAMITFYCKGGLREASIILENVCFECKLFSIYFVNAVTYHFLSFTCFLLLLTPSFAFLRLRNRLER